MTALSRQELKNIAAERLSSSANELVKKIQGRYVFYLSAKITEEPVGWMSFYGTYSEATIDEARRLLQATIPEAQLRRTKWTMLHSLFHGPDLYARLD